MGIKEEKVICYKTGTLFPKGTVFLGYLILAVGVVALISNVWVALFGIVFGGFISLGRKGTEVDSKNNSYREYISYFGIKFGKWIPMTPFPFVTLLSANVKSTTFAYNAAYMSASRVDKTFDITLLNKTHRKKVKIARFKSKEEAKKALDELTKKTGLEAVTYNPKRIKR